MTMVLWEPSMGTSHRLPKPVSKQQLDKHNYYFINYYINITITILDIIHRPVFHLKLNSALKVCVYLTGNTLRLLYEPNRLKLSIGL
jgi:hypothetical protein